MIGFAAQLGSLLLELTIYTLNFGSLKAFVFFHHFITSGTNPLSTIIIKYFIKYLIKKGEVPVG